MRGSNMQHAQRRPRMSWAVKIPLAILSVEIVVLVGLIWYGLSL